VDFELWAVIISLDPSAVSQEIGPGLVAGSFLVESEKRPISLQFRVLLQWILGQDRILNIRQTVMGIGGQIELDGI
jgi:hypothetical protein